MKRLAGVVVVAVVLIAGGAATAVLAATTLVTFILAPDYALGDVSPSLRTFVEVFTSFMFLIPIGLGIWAIVTAVGLLRRRKWARTSALVVTTFALVPAAFSLIFVLALPFLSGPDNTRVSMVRELVLLSISALPVALCVWALWYLNRMHVRQHFGYVPTTPFVPIPQLPKRLRRRPVGVALIGWYLAIAPGFLLISLPAYLHWNLPAIFFGVVFHDLRAVAVGAFWSAFSFAAGLALLKGRNWGRALAICVFAMGMVNILFMGLRPGFQTTMQQSLNDVYRSMGMPSVAQSLPLTPIIWFGIIAGLPIPVIAIIYLARQKTLLSTAETVSTS